jgi:hypothetical protein
MMQVALITEDQFTALRGVQFAEGSFCYPEMDGLGRPFISLDEMSGLGLELEVADYEPMEIDEDLERLTNEIENNDNG